MLLNYLINRIQKKVGQITVKSKKTRESSKIDFADFKLDGAKMLLMKFYQHGSIFRLKFQAALEGDKNLPRTCTFANMRFVSSIKHLSRYFKATSARKRFFCDVAALNLPLMNFFLFKQKLVYCTQDNQVFPFLMSPQTSKSVTSSETLLRTLEVTLLIVSLESQVVLQ